MVRLGSSELDWAGSGRVVGWERAEVGGSGTGCREGADRQGLARFVGTVWIGLGWTVRVA